MHAALHYKSICLIDPTNGIRVISVSWVTRIFYRITNSSLNALKFKLLGDIKTLSSLREVKLLLHLLHPTEIMICLLYNAEIEHLESEFDMTRGTLTL